MANLPRAGTKPPRKKLVWMPVVCLAAAMATLTGCAYTGTDKAPVSPVGWLEILAGYLILLFMAGIGIRILIKIYQNDIDLSKLLCEPKGGDLCAASMSRFQLLIFTFVISVSLFLIIVGNKPLAFPEVPNAILMLLGISASTYAVGKGIQASNGGGGGAAAGAAQSAHAAASQAHGHAAAARDSAADAQDNAAAARRAADFAEQAASAAAAAAPRPAPPI